MKKYPYTDLEVYRIFKALQQRGLAVFLGFRNKEPMIWMSDKTPWTREPLTIATAAMILDEILARELDIAFNDDEDEVVICEIFNRPVQWHARPPRRRVTLLLGGGV